MARFAHVLCTKILELLTQQAIFRDCHQLDMICLNRYQNRYSLALVDVDFLVYYIWPRVQCTLDLAYGG